MEVKGEKIEKREDKKRKGTSKKAKIKREKEDKGQE